MPNHGETSQIQRPPNLTTLCKQRCLQNSKRKVFLKRGRKVICAVAGIERPPGSKEGQIKEILIKQ